MNSFKRIYTTGMLYAATAITLPAETVTTIFNFGGTNGASPAAALVQGTNGYLYGTTTYAGSTVPHSAAAQFFEITPNGTLTTLHSFFAFSPCPDGAEPSAPLVQADSSEFYGTT